MGDTCRCLCCSDLLLLEFKVASFRTSTAFRTVGAHQLLIASSHLLIFSRTTIAAEFSFISQFSCDSRTSISRASDSKGLYSDKCQSSGDVVVCREISSIHSFGLGAAPKICEIFRSPHTFDDGLFGRARLSWAELPTVHSRLSALNLTVAK